MLRHAMVAAVVVLFSSSLVAYSRAAEPDPRLNGYRHPEGWKVQIAASEPLVVNPVTMTFGIDGRLYVIEWKAGRGPNDHIKVLTDTNGDGTFDRAEMYMDNLELPAGLLFWDGWTYVTLDHDLVRFKDRDGDGKFEVREVIASGFGNDDSHHRVSGIIMGPDGWIYMTTGDSDAHARGSDGSTVAVLRCGGVFRCRPDGSHMENVAFGMRNPWGNVAFDDAFRIFHTDNDNEGSPGFTGCRLLHAVEAGDYGWRLREGARCCAPDFERATWNGGRPGRLGWMGETGRGAPAGLGVLNSSAFPDKMRNLLVYPDVFRKTVRAYRLKPTGATFTVGEEFELLGSDEGLFRPTDAEVGPDGALYLLDWRTDSGGAGQLSGNGQTGRIYRMSWSGTKADPARSTFPRDRFVRLSTDKVETLVEALSDPDYGLRRNASLELMRRGKNSGASDLLNALIRDKQASTAAKLHALGVAWAVDFGSPRLASILDLAQKDSDPSVRRFALDIVGRAPSVLEAKDVETTLESLSKLLDGSTKTEPEVLRSAVLAVGRLGGLRNATVEKTATLLLRLAKQHATSDAFLRDGITRGIERLGPSALPVLVRAVSGPDASLSQAALFTLQGWRSPDALSAIIATATSKESEVNDDARVGLFRALREMAQDVPADPVARWLASSGTAGPRARVQAIQLLSAMYQRAVLATTPILDVLLKDPDAEVRRASLVLAREIRSEKAKAVLLATVSSDEKPAEERSLALSALRGYDGLDLIPLVRTVFPKIQDPGLRLELIRTLAAKDFPAAATLAEGLLPSKNRELRHEAIMLLGSKPKSAQYVADRFLAGELPPEDLSRVIDAVRPHSSPELQSTLQALLKKTLIAAPEGRRLAEFVGRYGNPDRGKVIYADAKKGACATCHRLEGSGGSVGPDLTRVWETLSFDKRVESILEPSKEIKEGFGTFKVATTDGRVLTGLLLSDTAQGVTLKDAEGREVRIPTKEVEEKGTEKTSLMPAGVVGHLSLNELADLLSFLGDRKAQESLRTAPGASAK